MQTLEFVIKNSVTVLKYLCEMKFPKKPNYLIAFVFLKPISEVCSIISH
jgi:hypothetical protein